MKNLSFSLVVLGLVGCAAKPAAYSTSNNKYKAADGRPAEADDCHDRDPSEDNASGDLDANGKEKEKDQASKDEAAGEKAPVTPVIPPVKDDVKVPPVANKPIDPVVPPPKTPETPKVPETKPTDPVVGTDRQEKIKAMLAAKKFVSEYTVTDANNWGTTKDKRIELFIAVDNNGKALLPSGLKPEVTGDMDPSKDQSFNTTAMHSTFKVCNQANTNIRLHAQPNIPFEHSISAIRKGACTIYLLRNANAIGDNKSWDHNIGEQLPIYFKVTKIKPDGSEM